MRFRFWSRRHDGHANHPLGRVDGDLKRFKEFIEKQKTPTGAWRGEIHGGRVERGGSGETPST